ncbi:hypothetical protein N8878_01130 [Psychromonas sp.]|nr:hypothetical protein [Psychromonas sp.]
MNGHQFNKIQYKFFAEHLSKDLGQVKSTKSCEWIVSTHRLGRIIDGIWFYTEKDRVNIINLAKQQYGTDLLRDPYPEKRGRIENARLNNNEKLNSLAVSEEFVLVNSLQTLQLNQEKINITEINTLGVYLNANKINSVEHETIVLVENLAVMANLQFLMLTDAAKHLKEAIWIYRGDVKAEQNTNRAYKFFRRFIGTHQLICFSDFDPEGIFIASKSGASQYLAVSIDALKNFNVKGPEQDYYNQIKTVNKLSKDPNLSVECRSLLNAMAIDKKTVKQEHILAHQIPLSLFEIK